MRRVLVVAAVALVLAGVGATLWLTASRPVVDPPVAGPAPALPAPGPAVSAPPPVSEPAPVPPPSPPLQPDNTAEREALESTGQLLEKTRQREAKFTALEAEERRQKQHLCPSYALPAFAWPDPPLPTTTTQIARAYLAAPGEPEPTTLGEVQKRLARLVQAAGYRVPSILGAGCQGFAMVLDLERLRDDGRRVDGSDGFSGPGQRQRFSIVDIMLELIKAEPGYFRVIVVVVSDEARAASTAQASAAQLRALADAGKATLPAGLNAKPFDEGYVVEALVYEFEKNPKAETADLRKPEGRLAATTHLAQARLIDLKRPAR